MEGDHLCVGAVHAVLLTSLVKICGVRSGRTLTTCRNSVGIAVSYAARDRDGKRQGCERPHKVRGGIFAPICCVSWAVSDVFVAKVTKQPKQKKG